ncbi:hypothetical protein LTR37_001533 [Vermiconidia calcicola]|uniref:Uncharacterized protein n=1 Tax=Vermiconidia calcicola TaxID=1690605 RepID=A0ACC3NV04_9PEZI|nr:hypothetical protein LTR37_001533 [Vermiconidia calcicola]
MASLTTMPSTLKNMPHSALAPLSTALAEVVERHDTTHTDQCPALSTSRIRSKAAMLSITRTATSPFMGTESMPATTTTTATTMAASNSYATVQGINCLIEKFRNSAIMDEYAGYRPKLFHTATSSPDPSMIGKEREFPPPDNDSKHKRSSDNATTVRHPLQSVVVVVGARPGSSTPN